MFMVFVLRVRIFILSILATSERDRHREIYIYQINTLRTASQLRWPIDPALNLMVKQNY